jgi:C4-dicarboxylate-specific signal transduction histidine kinase
MNYDLTTDPNVWVIAALVFLLGLLAGMWLTAGGRRKWKSRYKDEAERRAALEHEHNRRVAEWEAQEKEWRERDSLRAAAAKDQRAPNEERRTEGDRRAATRGEDDQPA